MQILTRSAMLKLCLQCLLRQTPTHCLLETRPTLLTVSTTSRPKQICSKHVSSSRYDQRKAAIFPAQYASLFLVKCVFCACELYYYFFIFECLFSFMLNVCPTHGWTLLPKYKRPTFEVACDIRSRSWRQGRPNAYVRVKQKLECVLTHMC